MSNGSADRSPTQSSDKLNDSRKGLRLLPPQTAQCSRDLRRAALQSLDSIGERPPVSRLISTTSGDARITPDPDPQTEILADLIHDARAVGEDTRFAGAKATFHEAVFNRHQSWTDRTPAVPAGNYYFTAKRSITDARHPVDSWPLRGRMFRMTFGIGSGSAASFIS